MYLVVLIVTILDPFSFLVALCLTVWLVRRWWQCILVGAAVALLNEVLMTAMQPTYAFGRIILPAAVAGTMHSAIAYAISRRYRLRRWVMAGMFAGALLLTIIPVAIVLNASISEYRELTP